MLKDGLEHCVFVRKQAISTFVQGAAFQVRNAQLTTYVEKGKAVRRKPKLQEIPERSDTRAGAWQTLQLHTRSNT